MSIYKKYFINDGPSTSFLQALKKNDTDYIKKHIDEILLQHDCLVYAISNERPDIAKLLFHLGANPNGRNFLGMSPLEYAIHKNYIDIAKLLLKQKVNINEKDENGDNPLIHALISGHPNVEMVKLLISKGADMNSFNEHGESAYTLAKRKYLKEIVSLFDLEIAKKSRDKINNNLNINNNNDNKNKRKL